MAIIFIAFAIIFLALGLILSGEDLIGWLTSKYAVLFYIVFGTYGLLVLFMIIGDKIRRL